MEITREDAIIISNLLKQVTVVLADAPMFLDLQKRVNEELSKVSE